MRDRLIELLDKVQLHGVDLPVDRERYPSDEVSVSNERIADHLLANGAMLVDTNTVDFITNRKPIQTAFGMPLDELADLIRAKQEGRIIVPHCKVGDTVYCITECSCEDIDGVHTECEFYGYGEDDRICSIPNGAKCPYQHRIMECYVTEANILMFTRSWGKTVFLTKEEAERAMKGGAE